MEKESINFVEEDEIMKIFVSGPFIFNNEVIGVGLTVVDAEVLEEIVRERTGLGDTGEVLVAIQGAEERIYLFDRLFESEAISQLIQSEETAEPMNNALAGNEKVFLDSLDYRDQRVIAVSQYISIAELGLVAKIDLNEAKGEQQDRIIKTTIIIVLVSGIYVFIVGLLISLYLSKSIRKLTKDVNDITKGKIDIQLEKSRILEISELTESLNRILASLKLAVLRTGLTKSEFGLGEVVKAKKFAEEKYKKIFEVVPSGIYTEDNDHIISSWNKKAEEITGFKAKEVINKKPNFYVKEKSVDFEKGVKMPILDQEAMIKTKKGKKIIVSINADNLTDVNERVIGKIITFQNITERKKKTEQLEKFVNLSVGRELRMKELKKELHKYKRRKK